MSDAQDGSNRIQLFTDGACIGNPGPGGWGFILKHPASGRSKSESGGEQDTTNNRMEILAVIRGLQALKKPSAVELFSDSQYVVNAINEWMHNWKRHGWRKGPKKKEQIPNSNLWQLLDETMKPHVITATWVRGHNGHIENEQCDQLAERAAARIATTPKPVEVPKAKDLNNGLFGS